MEIKIRKTMKTVFHSLLLAFLCQGVCYAEVTNLSTEHRNVLLDSARFSESKASMNLPQQVAELCADNNGNLAEPGQEWRATDNVSDPSIPSKRLIWVALADEYYVVHYERGGRGHSYHVLVATFTAGHEKSTAVWRAVGGPLKDYAEFLDALQRGELDDNLKYGY